MHYPFLQKAERESLVALHQKSFLDTSMPITARRGKKGTKCSRTFRLLRRKRSPCLHTRKVPFAKVQEACRAYSTVPTHQDF
jgi:hypothetical protein